MLGDNFICICEDPSHLIVLDTDKEQHIKLQAVIDFEGLQLS